MDSNAKKKVTGVRFLRGLNKQAKVIINDYRRVMKMKKTTTEGRGNRKSGFEKSYPVVPELKAFLTNQCGTDFQTFIKALSEPHNQLQVTKESYSRIDVTKILCNYVKFKKLQVENDRRTINLMTDLNLRKLLRCDTPFTNQKGEVEPPQENIRYSGIQKRIGWLFLKVTTTPPTEQTTVNVPVVTTNVATTNVVVEKPSVPRKLVKKVISNK